MGRLKSHEDATSDLSFRSGLAHRQTLIRSFFRFCLKKQSFRSYASYNRCKAEWAISHPTLVPQRGLGFFWGVSPGVSKKACLRMGCLLRGKIRGARSPIRRTVPTPYSRLEQGVPSRPDDCSSNISPGLYQGNFLDRPFGGDRSMLHVRSLFN
jgi:hypothetical protein